MKLLTNDIRERLLKNGRIRQQLAEDGRAEVDFLPVVKLFTPDAQCTWLLTELDPDGRSRRWPCGAPTSPPTYPPGWPWPCS